MQEISIILVEPQMGENIGAAARAMKNFALTDLRLVNPRDGWPNEKADNMSVGAIDLIQNAKLFTSLEEALDDLHFVYASTAAPRDMNKDYVLSRDLSNDLPNNGKIGIMFGRENCGLNNYEISLANKIITIDTQKDFSSLNIAHAIAVISSQIFQIKNNSREDLNNIQDLVTQKELQSFYNHLFSSLDKGNFFYTEEKKIQMSFKIRNIFNKIDNLSQNELKILWGVVNNLSK